jgi:hypothetical protein
MPYLDQRALWEELEGTAYPSEFVDVLLCPEDAEAFDAPGNLSYCYNGGTKWLTDYPQGTGIMTQLPQGMKLHEITDGTANTALIAERLTGDRSREFERSRTPAQVDADERRYLWWTSITCNEKDDELKAAQICRTSTTTAWPVIWTSSAYAFASSLSNGYMHLLTPNHRSCYNAADRYDFLYGRETVPAASNHAGGVHAVLVDGSVHFVSENIDNTAWTAIGTRSGGDTAVLP